MQHYLALKTEPSGHEKLWRRLKCTSLSDTSQPEKTKCSELYEILKKASYGDSKDISGCQGWGREDSTENVQAEKLFCMIL